LTKRGVSGMHDLGRLSSLDVEFWLTRNGWIPALTKANGALWKRGDFDVLVPSSNLQPDAGLRLQVALESIAESHGLAPSDLESEIIHFGSDVVEWRVVDSATLDDGLSLGAADQLISTVRRVVIFGAAAVDHRRGYFGRRVRQRARDEASRVRVGQTKRGSFILPLISHVGVGPGWSVGDLGFPVEFAPYSRQVLLTIFEALSASVALAELTEGAPSGRQANELVSKGVSYELSIAMAELLANETIRSLSVSFDWADAAPVESGRRTVDFNNAHAEFFRRLAANLFETAETGAQQILVQVKSSARHEDSERDGGVVVFRRSLGDRSGGLVRADLNEADYQTVLTADSRREVLAVVGKLVEEEGHRTRLEEVASVQRIVQATFEVT